MLLLRLRLQYADWTRRVGKDRGYGVCGERRAATLGVSTDRRPAERHGFRVLLSLLRNVQTGKGLTEIRFGLETVVCCDEQPVAAPRRNCLGRTI